MSDEAWVALIVGVLGLLGGIIAFRLGRRAEREDKQQEIKGILETIRRDVTRGIECAEGWRKIGKRAPAYRMPVATWNSSTTLLAGAEALTANQSEALARFFDLATELNHCFTRIEEVDQGFLSAEEARTLIKVGHILDVEPPNRDSVAARARNAIDEALARLQSTKRQPRQAV